MRRLTCAFVLAAALFAARGATAADDCGEKIEAGDAAAIEAFVQKYEYTNPLQRFNFWIPDLAREPGDAERLASCLHRLELLFAEYFANDPAAATRYSDLSWFLGYVNYFGLREQPAFAEIRARAHDALLSMIDRRARCDITRVLYLKYLSHMLLEYRAGAVLLDDLLPEMAPQVFYVRLARMAACGDPGIRVLALRLLLHG